MVITGISRIINKKKKPLNINSSVNYFKIYRIQAEKNVLLTDIIVDERTPRMIPFKVKTVPLFSSIIYDVIFRAIIKYSEY